VDVGGLSCWVMKGNFVGISMGVGGGGGGVVGWGLEGVGCVEGGWGWYGLKS